MRAVFCLFLAVVAATVCAPKAHAQDAFPFSIGPSFVADEPTDPLMPATHLNPKFPLRVVMLNGNWRYNHDHESKGDGVVLTEGGQLWYKYRCAWSFIPERAVYQARWLKPGDKLEILMAKPNQHKSWTCTLNTHA